MYSLSSCHIVSLVSLDRCARIFLEILANESLGLDFFENVARTFVNKF